MISRQYIHKEASVCTVGSLYGNMGASVPSISDLYRLMYQCDQ